MKVFSPQNMRGSALIIILIGIALFGFLAFAIGQSRKGSKAIMTTEEGRLMATEIVQYGNDIRLAVDKLVSLEMANSDATGLYFAASGANAAYGVAGAHAEAEVFNDAGGALTYRAPPQDACDTACVYDFSGQFAIDNIGTASADLVMTIVNLSAATCDKINAIQKTGFTSIPTEDAVALARFDGTTYGASSVSIGGTMAGLKSFCYQESGGSARYVFVHVLRAR
jgi:hypothetical protein